MNKTILNYLLIAIIAIPLGYFIRMDIEKKSADASEKAHTMDMSGMNMDTHDHGKLNIAKGYLEPTVKLQAFKDTMGGYNVQITTSNFKFTPQNAGQEEVTQNAGHAHIYVNGTKIGRYYGGGWIYIGADKFINGTNTITVSLNSDNHIDWYSNDNQRKIEAKTEVMVEPKVSEK